MLFNPGVAFIDLDAGDTSSEKPLAYAWAETEDKWMDPSFYLNVFSSYTDRTIQAGPYSKNDIKRGDSIPNRAWVECVVCRVHCEASLLTASSLFDSVLQHAGAKIPLQSGHLQTDDEMRSCPHADTYATHRQRWYRMLTRHNPVALQLGRSNATNSTSAPKLNADNDGWIDASNWPLNDQNKAFFRTTKKGGAVATVISTKMETHFLPPDADLVLMQFTNKTNEQYDENTFPDLQLSLQDPFNQTNVMKYSLSQVISDTMFVISSVNNTLILPLDTKNKTLVGDYKKRDAALV